MTDTAKNIPKYIWVLFWTIIAMSLTNTPKYFGKLYSFLSQWTPKYLTKLYLYRNCDERDKKDDKIHFYISIFGVFDGFLRILLAMLSMALLWFWQPLGKNQLVCDVLKYLILTLIGCCTVFFPSNLSGMRFSLSLSGIYPRG